MGSYEQEQAAIAAGTATRGAGGRAAEGGQTSARA